MSWSQPPDPNQPPPNPNDPNWVQIPPGQWPGSTPPPASGGNPPPGNPYQPPGSPYQQAPVQTTFTPNPSGYQSPYPYVGQKRRGCGCNSMGCIIALIVIVAVVVPIVAIVGSFGAFSNSSGDFLGQISQMVNSVVNVNQTLGISTTPLPGDANAFDSFAALAAVTTFAGEGAQLAEINAVQVRSDGTQNLNADYDPPRPNTDYEFYREIPRPENAPPVGAGGTTDGQWYEPVTVSAYRPGQMSQIRQTGGGMSISTQFINEGLKRQVQDPTTNLAFVEGFVGPPTCTTRQLWNVALEEGAPADAVATITYNSEGYEFTIPGGGIFLNFDANCKLQD